VTYQQLDWLMMESDSTLSAADSPAKTSALPEKAQDLPVSDQDSGGNITASSRKLGRRGSSQKTYQPFALGDWMTYSKASLRSGMTRNGTAYPLQPLALLTKGTASGSWPTPTSRDWKDGTAESCRNVPVNSLLGRAVHVNSTLTGKLNPQWVEWLMGFPSGWTDLKHLETP
jgi:hypothetical protein